MLQRTARTISGILGRDSMVIRSLRPAYESFLAWTHGGRGIPWTVNGMKCRIVPEQRHQFGHDYDPSVAKFLRERLRPGQTCFDVGANVGVYVLQFADWVGATGKVVAFEPNPVARAILAQHVELNYISARVTILGAAVGAASGTATLFALAADGMSRLGAPNRAIANYTKPIEVPLMTIDEYVAQSGLIPDVLMLDIEGFEIAALAGARQLINKRRDLLIVVEMHPGVWSSANTSRESAELLLQELALIPVPLQGQQHTLSEHGIVHLRQTDRILG